MGNINKIQKRKKKSLSPWSFTTILVFGLVLYYLRILPALLVYRKKPNNFFQGFLMYSMCMCICSLNTCTNTPRYLKLKEIYLVIPNILAYTLK